MAEEAPRDLRAWRKAQRARLLEERRVLPADAHKQASEAIMRELRLRLPPGSHELTGCYWPFRREFNCVPYMREILRTGGRVALPVVIARGQPLEFRNWNEEARMESGVWNIRHPASGPSVIPSALVIPLVGFDVEGYRLGYGAGYYDATVASFAAKQLLVGVGFEFSRLTTIYPQPHDKPMDVIITEARVRDTFARGSGWRGHTPIAWAPIS
jgi:5-formyltetrahydrofolate cyclo-ligase